MDQMITVTGAKGIAGNPQVTPEKFAVSMAAGFQEGRCRIRAVSARTR
jgi:hypothetical protein